MAEDNEWLENLPIMSYAVSLSAFEQLIDFLYNHYRQNVSIHDRYKRVVDSNILCAILYSMGYISSVKYIEAEITPNGKTFMEKIKDHLYLNERCQTFLKDYLLTNGFVAPEYDSEPKILPFSITEEQADKYEFSDEPLSLLQILNKINKLIDTAKYRKLTSNALADFLVDEGMLVVIPVEDGRFYRRATKKGNAEGIFYKDRLAGDGNTYLVNLYDKNAQFFIIDNLQTIALFASGDKKIRESRLNEVSVDVLEPDESVVKHTCKDCMDYRNGNCFGADKICEDFRFAPTFSRKETENWPEVGDATYLRRKGKNRY